jgi:hypothetical protein
MCSRHAEYGAGYDITDATTDALQGSAADYEDWVVKVARDRYDPDHGSVQLQVRGRGQDEARKLAWEQGRDIGLRHHVVLRVARRCYCGHEAHEFPCIAWGCRCERVAP